MANNTTYISTNILTTVGYEHSDICNYSMNSIVTNGSRKDCKHVAGATIFSPILMFLAGVLGNILALAVLYRSRLDNRTTKFYTLVAGLAWTDLTGILLTSPSTIAAYVNNRQWVAGEPHCRFHGFAMICFGLSTPLIVCAMAVERFLALKCVFFYSSRCKSSTARWVIVTLWIGVIFFGLLPLFGFGTFEKQYPGTWCFLDFHSSTPINNAYAILYSGLNLVVILLMTLCNGYVVLALLHARFMRRDIETRRESLINDRMDSGVPCKNLRKKQGDIELQMIVLMCTITTVFAVCWAPLMIQIVITVATKKTNYFMDLTAVRMASLNQTLDPWLYILLRRSLLHKVKTTCAKLFCKRDKKTDVDNNDHRVQNIYRQPRLHAQKFRSPACNIPRINVHAPPAGIEAGASPFDARLHHNLWEQPNDENQDESLLGTDSSLPDVMPTGGGPPSTAHALPDVAETSNSQESEYICTLEIGNNASKGDKLPDEGIYVKFMFVPKKGSEKQSVCKTSSGSSEKNRATRTCSCGSSKGSTSCKQKPKQEPEKVLTSSGIFTKETSLPLTDTHFSEVVSPVEHSHDQLRRTKSNI